MLTVSDYGNVDCKQGIPDGYKMIYGVEEGNSRESSRFWAWIAREQIEWYTALVGFDRVESQHFSQAHFSKPAHWRPHLEIIIPCDCTPPTS